MKIYRGEIVSKGIAMGEIVILEEGRGQDISLPSLPPQKEMKRFRTAHQETLLQLDELFQKASKEVGEQEALIFETHKMMLQDLDLIEFIETKIASGNSALHAIEEARDYFVMVFEQMEDAYMKARSLDIKDITGQLLAHLRQSKTQEIRKPSLLLARDLTPSQTLKIKRENLLGIVTLEGSHDSHTAILAKTMRIPALFGISAQSHMHGEFAILDGKEGYLILNPNEEMLAKYQNLLLQERQTQQELENFRGKPSQTKSGKNIMLYANAGSIEDIKDARKGDAEGIGLLRSEFLYLQSQYFPSEEDQFEFYKKSLLEMQDKKVIVRTLDIGADKQIGYFHFEREENPALGYRGIRVCLDRVEIFKTQLRALFRASLYGRLGIMFPMIISLQEVRAIKEILEELKEEFKRSGIAFCEDIELGVMIETPASALIAEDLAKEVDFLSIGTNDLMQYTLALDRQNPKLTTMRDPYHPALLKLIEMTIDAGHRHECWVGICGEFAQEERAIEILIKMGIDELSVAPNAILEIRKKIQSLN